MYNRSTKLIAIGILYLLTLFSIVAYINPIGAEKINEINEQSVGSYYWSIKADDEEITNIGSNHTPIVQTLNATEIGPASTMLNAKLIYDGGSECQGMFKNRKKGTQDWETSLVGDYEYESEDEFHTYCTCLEFDTTYEFKAGARNGYPDGESWGEIKEYTTLPCSKPVVATKNPVIDYREFTLKGKCIDDGGMNCNYDFRYRKKGDDEWYKKSGWWYGPIYTNDTFEHTYKFDDFSKEATYEFQAGLLNAAGEGWGWTKEFILPNRPPDTPHDPCPSNGEKIGLVTSIDLQVLISDPNGDYMDVYFYEHTADYDFLIGKCEDRSNVGYFEWNYLSYRTTYQWFVVANDGDGLETRGPKEGYWSFKTEPRSRSYSLLQNFLDEFPLLEQLLH